MHLIVVIPITNLTLKVFLLPFTTSNRCIMVFMGKISSAVLQSFVWKTESPSQFYVDFNIRTPMHNHACKSPTDRYTVAWLKIQIHWPVCATTNIIASHTTHFYLSNTNTINIYNGRKLLHSFQALVVSHNILGPQLKHCVIPRSSSSDWETCLQVLDSWEFKLRVINYYTIFNTVNSII